LEAFLLCDDLYFANHATHFNALEQGPEFVGLALKNHPVQLLVGHNQLCITPETQFRMLHGTMVLAINPWQDK
jgi:hypothetical protein